VSVSIPSITADIYNGGVFVKTIAFNKVGEEDYIRNKNWWTVFEGDYLPDSKTINNKESKSFFFSAGLNFKNIQITKIQATNFHLVKVHIYDKKKN
jgi:hypothetical protein